MKKLTVLLLLVFAIAKIHAQNYRITFAGTGASTTVDSVKVENLTQGTWLTLPGADTLHLIGTQGFDNATINGDKIRVYPNPMQGQTELSFYAKKAGKAQLIIYDISGKGVLQTAENLQQGIQQHRITGLKQGIYFIHISGENYFYNAKLISLNSSQSKAIIEYFGSEKPETAIGKLKSTKAIISMAYTTGDSLRFTGYSGILSSIVADVPTSSKTIIFNFEIVIPNCGTVSDIDGNIYNTIQIGTQCWMRENLKTSRYKNDTIIDNVTDNAQWFSLTTDAWCLFNNDTSNNRIFGKMYNWYAAVNTYGLCPGGWHVPSSAAWDSLTTYLTDNAYGYGGSGNDIAKSLASEAGWRTFTTPGTVGNDQSSNNTSGFTALPGGYRGYNGAFDLNGSAGYFWSKSEANVYNSYRLGVGYNISTVSNVENSKTRGFSVRCIKDNPPSLQIGQTYQGGIIFYIDSTGQHGLISATADQSTGAEWGCSGTAVGASSTAIGTGQANTTAIVNGCLTAGIPARLCNDLVLNGYDDWFLPSKDELNLMYVNLHTQSLGGFASSVYWSSSEGGANYAVQQSFSENLSGYTSKINVDRVRAARAF